MVFVLEMGNNVCFEVLSVRLEILYIVLMLAV